MLQAPNEGVVMLDMSLPVSFGPEASTDQIAAWRTVVTGMCETRRDRPVPRAERGSHPYNPNISACSLRSLSTRRPSGRSTSA